MFNWWIDLRVNEKQLKAVIYTIHASVMEFLLWKESVIPFLNHVLLFSAFSKPSLNVWKFLVHALLKTHLENFEHYFAGVWDEWNCMVVWTFFGIAFLWDWNENWTFQPCGHCWVFQICWHIECSTFTASSFRIWNSSAGIPLLPLVWVVVMLPKTHLTSYSRMSGSR